MEEGSAASAIGPFGPAILMNSKEAPWRRNYNFAHELFHLITWESLKPALLLQQRLKRQFTERLFRDHLQVGKANRITGPGMRR